MQAHTSTGEPSLPIPVQRKRATSSSSLNLCKAPRLLSTSSSGRRVTRFDCQHVEVNSSDSIYEEESDESLLYSFFGTVRRPPSPPRVREFSVQCRQRRVDLT